MLLFEISAVPCGTGNGKTSSGDSAKHNIVMLNLNTLQALDNIKEPPQDSNDALAQLTSCRPQDVILCFFLLFHTTD